MSYVDKIKKYGVEYDIHDTRADYNNLVGTVNQAINNGDINVGDSEPYDASFLWNTVDSIWVSSITPEQVRELALQNIIKVIKNPVVNTIEIYIQTENFLSNGDTLVFTRTIEDRIDTITINNNGSVNYSSITVPTKNSIVKIGDATNIITSTASQFSISSTQAQQLLQYDILKIEDLYYYSINSSPHGERSYYLLERSADATGFYRSREKWYKINTSGSCNYYSNFFIEGDRPLFFSSDKADWRNLTSTEQNNKYIRELFNNEAGIYTIEIAESEENGKIYTATIVITQINSKTIVSTPICANNTACLKYYQAADSSGAIYRYLSWADITFPNPVNKIRIIKIAELPRVVI